MPRVVLVFSLVSLLPAADCTVPLWVVGCSERLIRQSLEGFFFLLLPYLFPSFHEQQRHFRWGFERVVKVLSADNGFPPRSIASLSGFSDGFVSSGRKRVFCCCLCWIRQPAEAVLSRTHSFALGRNKLNNRSTLHTKKQKTKVCDKYSHFRQGFALYL